MNSKHPLHLVKNNKNIPHIVSRHSSNKMSSTISCAIQSVSVKGTTTCSVPSISVSNTTDL